MSKWQPIETAPKDRLVLLYRPTQRAPREIVALGKYDDNRFARKPRPFWRSWMDCSSRVDDRNHPPTHWMPLPAPPEVQP